MKIPSEVQGYLKNVPPERLNVLFSRIRKRFPEATLSLRYRMPTFELGDAWIAVGNQKSYLSVYTCERAHIEPYLKVHPKTKVGTGCLNFPDNAQIDLEALDAVIDQALTAEKQIGRAHV